MIWLILFFAIGLLLGIAIGVVWVNVSVMNAIGRHLGW